MNTYEYEVKDQDDEANGFDIQNTPAQQAR